MIMMIVDVVFGTMGLGADSTEKSAFKPGYSGTVVERTFQTLGTQYEGS